MKDMANLPIFAFLSSRPIILNLDDYNHTHTLTYLYIHTHTYTQTHTLTHTHTNTYIHTLILTHIHTCKHTHKQTTKKYSLYLFLYYMHTYMHIYMVVNISKTIHTYQHVRNQPHKWKLGTFSPRRRKASFSQIFWLSLHTFLNHLRAVFVAYELLWNALAPAKMRKTSASI